MCSRKVSENDGGRKLGIWYNRPTQSKSGNPQGKDTLQSARRRKKQKEYRITSIREREPFYIRTVRERYHEKRVTLHNYKPVALSKINKLGVSGGIAAMISGAASVRRVFLS